MLTVLKPYGNSQQNYIKSEQSSAQSKLATNSDRRQARENPHTSTRIGFAFTLVSYTTENHGQSIWRTCVDLAQ